MIFTANKPPEDSNRRIHRHREAIIKFMSVKKKELFVLQLFSCIDMKIASGFKVTIKLIKK
jgi:hypothetical protein